jgi:MFS family permease
VTRGDKPPVTPFFMFAYFLAQLAAWTGILTPVVVTIAVRVSQIATPEEKAAQLGIILSIGALGAMLAAPVWGAISDRTTARIGKRKLWLILGPLFLLSGLLIMSLSADLLVLGIGWFICQVGSNATQAALSAVLPDVVPEHQWGRMSGLLGLTVPLAILLGTFLTTLTNPNPLAMFVVPWLLLPVAITLLLLAFRDHPADPSSMGRYTLREFGRTFWVNPVKHPDYGWTWFSRFLVVLGLSFFATYQVYFLTDHLHVGTAEVATFVFFSTFLTTIIAVLESVAGGWLSDRVGRRKPFVWAAAFIAGVGLLIIGTSGSFGQFLVGAALTSLGQGLYIAVDLALIAAVLPDPETAAKDLGVFNIASCLPQSLAPALAPLFLLIGGGANYPAVFVAATAFAVLGAVVVVPIRRVR